MEVPRHWRLQKIRYGLIGDHCLVCDDVTFPPKDICSECSTEDLLKLRKISGTIYDSNKNITSNTPAPAEIVQG